MAPSTAARVLGRTGRVSFSTCETVATETPARRATSTIVVIRLFLPRVRHPGGAPAFRGSSREGAKATTLRASDPKRKRLRKRLRARADQVPGPGGSGTICAGIVRSRRPLPPLIPLRP
ncbi:hypothetical protein Sliba_66300 [Streptomyces nigrescens]|uniref:Uncharacterized protein n=1 Tax=Streptomyces nigrescens TaxID=1920 RepID=A0A640TRD6_STRNI|nr:hypothetical protein Sliba_66300 [Streptomyces libani subsp. libani]GGW05701.1 hypothetical protein GCM10010500_70690 [Streptomyces libani subsp. libani]